MAQPATRPLRYPRGADGAAPSIVAWTDERRTPTTTLRQPSPLDAVPYGPYGYAMAKLKRKGAEEARAQLPSLLADAENGVRPSSRATGVPSRPWFR